MTAISIGVSNSTFLMKSCASTPITTAGRKAISTETRNRNAAGSCGAARNTDPELAGIDRQDRQHRAKLDHNLEGAAGTVKTQEMPGQQEMRRSRKPG